MRHVWKRVQCKQEGNPLQGLPHQTLGQQESRQGASQGQTKEEAPSETQTSQAYCGTGVGCCRASIADAEKLIQGSINGATQLIANCREIIRTLLPILEQYQGDQSFDVISLEAGCSASTPN